MDECFQNIGVQRPPASALKSLASRPFVFARTNRKSDSFRKSLVTMVELQNARAGRGLYRKQPASVAGLFGIYQHPSNRADRKRSSCAIEIKFLGTAVRKTSGTGQPSFLRSPARPGARGARPQLIRAVYGSTTERW